MCAARSFTFSGQIGSLAWSGFPDQQWHTPKNNVNHPAFPEYISPLPRIIVAPLSTLLSGFF